MQQDNPIKLLRMLKGAPISILLAIAWSRQPVSNNWLATVTGYTDKPVASALQLLDEYGLITRTSQGWMIAKGTQLQLGKLDAIGPSRKNSDSSCSLIKESGEFYSEEEEEQESEKFRLHLNPNFDANLAACLISKIRQPKAGIIADLPHVTPEYIYAHVKQAREEGNALGTAIYRIENAWEQPAPAPQPARQASYNHWLDDDGDNQGIFDTGETYR